MTTTEPLVKYSVRTNDLYDEHVLQGGEIVYKAEDVVRVLVPFLELGIQRYAELFEHAGLGKAQDSVFIQEAQHLLDELGGKP